MQNRPIIDYCQKLGIAVTAYSPLARGAVVGDPVLEEIGKARSATSDQVALAFLIAKGHVVIPSSSKRDRIMQNFEARKITLTLSRDQTDRRPREGHATGKRRLVPRLGRVKAVRCSFFHRRRHRNDSRP